MFRNLIPTLADSYHVVAPDLPGFGFSDAPDRKRFRYTFENLAKVIGSFTQSIGLQRFAIYVFDYGAPVGLRLALAHPERITALISQNGNAYEDGLSQGWNPIQKYWQEQTPENRAALRDFLKPEATKWQYVHGVRDEDDRQVVELRVLVAQRVPRCGDRAEVRIAAGIRARHGPGNVGDAESIMCGQGRHHRRRKCSRAGRHPQRTGRRRLHRSGQGGLCRLSEQDPALVRPGGLILAHNVDNHGS